MRATKLVALATALATSAVLGVGLAGASSATTQSTSAPATAAVPAATPFEDVPVTGTLADGTGAVTGVLDITRFKVLRDGQTRTLVAVGTFTGEITDSEGKVLASGSEEIALPVDVDRSGAGSGPGGLRSTSALAAAQLVACDILNLVLGPLDLNVLGLEIHLNQVILDIVAQTGAGNLLGNLLCAIVGLLDGPPLIGGILNGIAALLNRLLAILG